MSALTSVDSNDPNAKKVAPSFSGNERNRMFLQRNGNFSDVSLVSGADFRQDGRGFALFDYDRDGFVDLVVTSPTSPRLRILRNTLGDRLVNKSNFVNVRLTGGNKKPAIDLDLSNSNACGAMVKVTIDGKTRMFEETCGEGLSTQNSKWIHIGLGDATKIDSIEITWPSQKTTVRENVEAGAWLKISEEPKG